MLGGVKTPSFHSALAVPRRDGELQILQTGAATLFYRSMCLWLMLWLCLSRPHVPQRPAPPGRPAPLWPARPRTRDAPPL